MDCWNQKTLERGQQCILMKRKWIMNLSVSPRLSGEGILNFQYSNAKQFSEGEKLFMTENLMKMNFDKDEYLKLLEWVHEFMKKKTK